MKTTKYLLAAALLIVLLGACNKVSPVGVLVAGTAVEDRVKMSNLYYQEYLDDFKVGEVKDEYTFLVGADSHLTTDPGRMDEMMAIALQNDDLLMAHLGDIADTKPEYYIKLDSLLKEGKKRYAAKYFTVNEDGYYLPKEDEDDIASPYTYDDIVFPFFPVVGNHDITHNGWALWSNIFHSSFYEFDIAVTIEGGKKVYDHFIFLDTASGTLGSTQVNLINDGVLDPDTKEHIYRHTFVFSHTNIFRPSASQFASTFSREETFFLLKQFRDWKASMVFCGHVHAWDDRVFEGVTYLTLDSMCEDNSPQAGDYLVRVHVKKDGTLSWEKVHMNYVKKK